MASIFQTHKRFISVPGTAVVLGDAATRFNVAIIEGRRDDGQPNQLDVWLGPSETKGAWRVGPGQTRVIRAPLNTFYTFAQFYLHGLTTGDGVSVFYSFANFKTFNAVEMRLERAIERYIKTIAASLEEGSITPGVTQEQRLAFSIVAHVPSMTEWKVNTARWICDCDVIVRTPVDVEAADDKHDLRIAYVRDLLMDDQLPEILSAFGRNITVHNREEPAETTHETDPENRCLISRISFDLHCSGSQLYSEPPNPESLGDVSGGFVGDVDGEPIPLE